MENLISAKSFQKKEKLVSCSAGVFFLVLFTYEFVMNSWVGDDPYITNRLIDNFVNGYGLRWNVVERVQVFTCPLWMFILSGLYCMTSEFYYTILAASYSFCILSLGIVWSRYKDVGRFALFIALLLSSKAFVDYTSSGLENPLSYFFVVVFYLKLFRQETEAQEAGRKEILFFVLIASLAYLTRPDSILLYIIPLGYLTAKGFRSHRLRIIRPLALGLLPVVIWEIFSLIYFGFLFPNSYYAKLGLDIPSSVLLKQGINYAANSLSFDPFTLSLVLFAIIYAAVSRNKFLLMGSASVLLYIIYTVKIGGDFMSGRFFSLPFLISALMITKGGCKRHIYIAAISVIVLYNLIHPWAPIKTDPREPWDHPYTVSENIYDEAGGYRRGTNMLWYYPFTNDMPSETFPKFKMYETWAVAGNTMREENVEVSLPYTLGIGYFGFFAGPDVYIIDAFGVTDPLLARLKVPKEEFTDFRPGHVLKHIPEGYMKSLQEDKNLLTEDSLSEYYEKLRIITRGRLLGLKRIKYIMEFNFGRSRRYDKEVLNIVNVPGPGVYILK
jgi:arabinofuranosyltransferase